MDKRSAESEIEGEPGFRFPFLVFWDVGRKS
jgi:hypothetical protein